ncbi:hypothetical protein F2Q69_00014132 [Brassica cretica]|uniref:Uncharacterized protein n=1 Tax=Brassica cretica TaxID=69181 RepID=A0A8S9QNU0_BRACR|nr:hypothetical protein F2Q69_00014132 [Brassica cretica]
MDRASMVEFDFSRLPRSWAENIAPSGSSSMSDGIRGLIGILRRDRSNVSSFDQTRIRTVFAMPEGTNTAPLVGERRSPISLSPGSEDETVVATRKRRRSSKGALPGPSRPRFVPEGDGSLFAAQGDLISLAGRMRSAGYRLPSLASSVEKEAYAKVAVAGFKVMEAFNEYIVVMEDHVVVSRNDKEIDSIGSEIKRLLKELEATKREGKKDAEKIEALIEYWKRIH